MALWRLWRGRGDTHANYSLCTAPALPAGVGPSKYGRRDDEPDGEALIAGLRQAIEDYGTWMKNDEARRLPPAATRPEMINAMVRHARKFVDFVYIEWLKDHSLLVDELQHAAQDYRSHLDTAGVANRTRLTHGADKFVGYLTNDWRTRSDLSRG